MSNPYAAIDSFRDNDEAFVGWLKTLPADYGDGGGLFASKYNNAPLIAVMAGPERALAGLVEILTAQKLLSPTDLARIDAKRPDFPIMPFATWTRGDDQQVPQFRDNVTPLLTKPDPATGHVDVYPAPRRITIPYTVRFWMNKTYTNNNFRGWLAAQFGELGCHDNERMLRVDHAPPFGSVRQSLKLIAKSDETDREGPDVNYKRLRVDFELKGFVFKPKSTLEDIGLKRP